MSAYQPNPTLVPLDIVLALAPAREDTRLRMQTLGSWQNCFRRSPMTIFRRLPQIPAELKSSPTLASPAVRIAET